MLDLGYANAEPRYLQARDALKIPLLVGLDLAAAPQSGICPVAGDALAFPFRHEAFDLVLAISAIDRIGRDNSRYCDGHRRELEFGDLEAYSPPGIRFPGLPRLSCSTVPGALNPVSPTG